MTKVIAPLQGLVAATFTPLHEDRSLHLDAIAPMVDRLISQGLAALYVLGSTGEGASLTFDERCAVAESFVCAADGRLPVIVQHIPAVTGASVNAIEFLKLAEQRIENLRGVKFTSQNVFEFQTCVEYAEERLQIFWGLDEMLQCGLAAGAVAAVGSTYNFAPAIYCRLLAAFAAGDMETVRQEELRSQAIVSAFIPYGPRGAQEAIMKMIGIDCAPTRLPVPTLTQTQYAALERELRDIGFFEWIKPLAETSLP